MEYFKTLSGASKFHSFNSNISIQLWQVPQSFPESALRELEEGWEAVRQRRGVLAQGVVSTENAILFSYPSQDNLLTYKDDSSEAFYLSVEDQVAARMDFVDRYMLSQQKGHYCLIHIKSLKADFVVCAK